MPGFLFIDGEAHPVSAARSHHPGMQPDVSAVVAVQGEYVWVHLDGATRELRWQDELSYYAAEETVGAADVARAPMPGTVVAVSVAAGSRVHTGDILLVIESMKLETVISAPRDGLVEAVHVSLGQSFERDATLVSLMPTEPG